MDLILAVPRMPSWRADSQLYLTVHYFTSQCEPIVSVFHYICLTLRHFKGCPSDQIGLITVWPVVL
jgi:hypothetical protein